MVALKTFNNLTEPRKEEILHVCLEEFALHEYQSASLSRIIRKLDLAKGSFYRYFENKKDLYFYLLDYCVQKRLESDARLIEQPSQDFFELVLQHFSARISFDKEQPLLSAFLYNVLHEKNNQELGNIRLVRKQKALEVILKLVDGYIKKGKLRTDINREVIAWHILQTQLSIIDFIEQRFQQDFSSNIKNHQVLHTVPEDEVMETARQFVDLIKHGLQTQSG